VTGTGGLLTRECSVVFAAQRDYNVLSALMF
jgi:hypothetical protein